MWDIDHWTKKRASEQQRTFFLSWNSIYLSLLLLLRYLLAPGGGGGGAMGYPLPLRVFWRKLAVLYRDRAVSWPWLLWSPAGSGSSRDLDGLRHLVAFVRHIGCRIYWTSLQRPYGLSVAVEGILEKIGRVISGPRCKLTLVAVKSRRLWQLPRSRWPAASGRLCEAHWLQALLDLIAAPLAAAAGDYTPSSHMKVATMPWGLGMPREICATTGNSSYNPGSPFTNMV